MGFVTTQESNTKRAILVFSNPQHSVSSYLEVFAGAIVTMKRFAVKLVCYIPFPQYFQNCKHFLYAKHSKVVSQAVWLSTLPLSPIAKILRRALWRRARTMSTKSPPPRANGPTVPPKYPEKEREKAEKTQRYNEKKAKAKIDSVQAIQGLSKTMAKPNRILPRMSLYRPI